MNKKILIVLGIIIVGFSALAVLEYTYGTISGVVFDQITYNYTSKVWIPPTNPDDPNSASLGGFYKINGKGRDFHFFLKLTGAEKSESPLDYTADGLNGDGRIEYIKVTPSTIYSLLSKDIRGAMFNTTFKGRMNMTCAAWTGNATFQNNGTSFTGTFWIDGVMTDWEGNFTLVREGTRIALNSDYIYYHNALKSDAKRVQRTYYM